MTTLRLYVDEDACENAVIVGLRARGVDLLTTLEAHRTGTSDLEQLEFAASIQRAIYTFNAADFAQLHAAWLNDGRPHSGIVMIPDQRCSVGIKIRRLAQLVYNVSAEDIANRIVFL